jgi:hypothetical protein
MGHPPMVPSVLAFLCPRISVDTAFQVLCYSRKTISRVSVTDYCNTRWKRLPPVSAVLTTMSTVKHPDRKSSCRIASGETP